MSEKREMRAKIIADMTALNDLAANEKRSFTDEEKVKFDDMENQVKTLDAEIESEERQATLAGFNTSLPAQPVEEKRGNVMESAEWGKLAESMQKRSAVTLNGTGAVLTMRELVKKITDKTDILNRAKYYYGPNQSTNIPVWASHMSAAFVDEEGTITQQNKTLGKTTITPAQVLSSLPVSQMTLDLSAASLESELPGLFSVAFADLMATQMMTGDGTKMQGIFTDANITKEEKSLSIANLAGLALKVQAKNYSAPCIVMNSAVYAAFMADTATDESTKLYKESLIRAKEIEGVPVVLTPYAPSSYASGAICAVAGDLSNYALGVAGELKVKAKDTAASDVVTFDAYAYFSGKPVISSDFIGFKVA